MASAATCSLTMYYLKIRIHSGEVAECREFCGRNFLKDLTELLSDKASGSNCNRCWEASYPRMGG